MKKCPKCDTTKPKSEFYKDASRKDGLSGYCRQCNSQRAKEWKEKNPDKVKGWKKNNPDYKKEWRKKNPDYEKEWREKNPDKLKEQAERRTPRQYGLTIEQYNNLLDQQNNRCAICGGVNKSGKALSVDHDHSCCKGGKSCGKCVRKLLCMKCNLGVGNFQDNPQLLRQAAEYIEKHTK